MHPMTTDTFANDHIRELHAAADRRRLARLARRPHVKPIAPARRM
jgi:hypothetical protein